MSALKGLTRNISWNYVEAGVNVVVFFLLTPMVVGRLGSEGYGSLVLLYTILFYLRFLDFGFHNALVKYIAEFAERRAWATINGFIGTTTSVLMIAGIGAFLLSGVVAWLIVPALPKVPAEWVPTLRLATLLIGVDLLLAFPASVLGAIFEGRQRFDVLSGVSIVASILIAVATVLLLQRGYGIVALIGLEIAGTLFTTAVYLVLLRRLFPELHLGFGRIGGPTLQRIRSYSGWTSLNEILAEGGAEVEKLLIPVLLPVSMLAPYNLVGKIAAGVFMAIEPIVHVFFPLSSAYGAAHDKVRLRELLVRGTKFVMAVGLPLSVAIIAYGETFLLDWIGDDINIPAGVMPIVVANVFTTTFVLTAVTILLALSKVRRVFWMGIAELVLAVIAMSFLVPRFELAGLAGSLLIANVIMTFGWVVPYACRVLDQRMMSFLVQSLARPLLAVVPMALFMLWLDQRVINTSLVWLITKAGLAGCVYLLAFYGVSLTSDERIFCYSSVRNVLGRKP